MPQSALRQFTPQSAEPAVRSYNPFNPAFRETMRSGIADLLGGRAMGGTPSQRYRAGIADMLTGAVDFVPGVSEAVGVSDTVQAARGGNYGTAAILGGATMLGMLPVVGDVASKAVREGLDMSTAAKPIQNAAEDSFTVYQGTPHVFGHNQLVRDVQTGKEYVSDPNMVRVISAANPNRYEVLADNPLGIFDLNRLGTGEGAQAFGEGIYTAEAPDVGRFYRGSLLQRSGIDDTFMIGSKPIADVYSEIEQRASKLSGGAASKEYDKLSILEQVMVDGDVLGVTQNKDYFSPEAFDWFSKNVAPNFNRPGALYEVQINSPKSSFLDWDKPLNEQPAGVREKLAALPGVKDTDTGQSIYAAIRSGYMGMENRGESRASLLLKSLGIPGLQYFDEGSRMAGEGSRNYVLFDPKIANITAKYGAAGGAIGLSALRGLQSDEQERKPD